MTFLDGGGAFHIYYNLTPSRSSHRHIPCSSLGRGFTLLHHQENQRNYTLVVSTKTEPLNVLQHAAWYPI